MENRDQTTERVPVEIRDPALTERANEILTDEARAVLGTDEVELPPDQAARVGREHPRERRTLDALWDRRMILGNALGAAVIVAAILVLTTGSWWWLILPLGLHVVATVIVVAAAIRATTVVESPSPTAVAALDEEGVSDAERVFDEHVREFSGGTPERQSGVLRSGGNVRTEEAGASGAAAATEERTAMTPSSEATAPAPAEPGSGGAEEVPDWTVLIPAFAAAALMLAAIVIPLAAGGGLLWLLVVAVWPVSLALIAYEVKAYRGAQAARGD